MRRLALATRWTLRSVQLAVFIFAGICAFELRFDFSIPVHYRPYLVAGICAWVAAKVLVFHLFRMDRGKWRYVSIPDLLRLAAANVAASALACVGLLAAGPPGFPRSLYLVDLLLCFILTGGVRVAVRVVAEFSMAQARSSRKRALIYGAGAAGVSLLREIHQNPALPYEVVGFVDDKTGAIGTMIQRARILGPGRALPDLVKAHAIETVLIAIPSATGAQMAAILKHCHDAGVSYKTVPGLAEVIESAGLGTQMRDVAVEDLLGRTPVRLDHDVIRSKIASTTVLVTGAAGSIGSELCRQIAPFRPGAIVAFDIAETALFHLEREMRLAFPGIPLYPEIGSIQNARRLADLFTRYRPSTVFHAAAYKHVPMMESHPFEAVENNVFGTLNLAAAAEHHGVSDFVMISSDKAVRPTNIMGATKRVAELLIHSMQNGTTKFVSVRFGNVLGSNGSVVPIFKSQIAAGGPVTVTHPEMRRYFMTIPEAVQLVLQASTMGRGGEIFVLDMGEPVKIVDLATNLILLSGLRPGNDIRIEFTGVRPGEKLYEELNVFDETTLATYHEKIKIFASNGVPENGMAPHLEVLRNVCHSRDVRRLVLELKELVPEYNPSSQLLQEALYATPDNGYWHPVEPVPTPVALASTADSNIAPRVRDVPARYRSS